MTMMPNVLPGKNRKAGFTLLVIGAAVGTLLAAVSLMFEFISVIAPALSSSINSGSIFVTWTTISAWAGAVALLILTIGAFLLHSILRHGIAAGILILISIPIIMIWPSLASKLLLSWIRGTFSSTSPLSSIFSMSHAVDVLNVLNNIVGLPESIGLFLLLLGLVRLLRQSNCRTGHALALTAQIMLGVAVLQRFSNSVIYLVFSFAAGNGFSLGGSIPNITRSFEWLAMYILMLLAFIGAYRLFARRRAAPDGANPVLWEGTL